MITSNCFVKFIIMWYVHTKLNEIFGKLSLETFDRRIHDILQRDADLSVAKLAARVGLNKNPCWRRLQKLQEQGVIRPKVALLDPTALNQSGAAPGALVSSTADEAVAARKAV